MVLRVATLVLFTVGWIPVFRYRSEHMRTKLAAATPGERRWIPLTTIVISLHVTLAQAIITMPLVGLASVPAGATARLLLGQVVFVGGVAWWFWARRALGPLEYFVDTVAPPERLLVSGPFAVIRHPLAFGTLLCALGPAIAAGALASWISFTACAACLAKRCLQDEALLWETFGAAYGGYAARTRRLIPFVW